LCGDIGKTRIGRVVPFDAQDQHQNDWCRVDKLTQCRRTLICSVVVTLTSKARKPGNCVERAPANSVRDVLDRAPYAGTGRAAYQHQSQSARGK
jgi:hypothetical protein